MLRGIERLADPALRRADCALHHVSSQRPVDISVYPRRSARPSPSISAYIHADGLPRLTALLIATSLLAYWLNGSTMLFVLGLAWLTASLAEHSSYVCVCILCIKRDGRRPLWLLLLYGIARIYS
jgi:hypothetical protein